MQSSSQLGKLSVTRSLSDEKMDLHFKQQMELIREMSKAHPRAADRELCLKWLSVFSRTTKDEKAVRNCLIDLMHSQLKKDGQLGYPFTDELNCNRDLRKCFDMRRKQVKQIKPELKVDDKEVGLPKQQRKLVHPGLAEKETVAKSLRAPAPSSVSAPIDEDETKPSTSQANVVEQINELEKVEHQLWHQKLISSTKAMHKKPNAPKSGLNPYRSAAVTGKTPPAATGKAPPAATAKQPPAVTAKPPPAVTAKPSLAATAKAPPAASGDLPAGNRMAKPLLELYKKKHFKEAESDLDAQMFKYSEKACIDSTPGLVLPLGEQAKEPERVRKMLDIERRKEQQETDRQQRERERERHKTREAEEKKREEQQLEQERARKLKEHENLLLRVNGQREHERNLRKQRKIANRLLAQKKCETDVVKSGQSKRGEQQRQAKEITENHKQPEVSNPKCKAEKNRLQRQRPHWEQLETKQKVLDERKQRRGQGKAEQKDKVAEMLIDANVIKELIKADDVKILQEQQKMRRKEEQIRRRSEELERKLIAVRDKQLASKNKPCSLGETQQQSRKVVDGPGLQQDLREGEAHSDHGWSERLGQEHGTIPAQNRYDTQQVHTHKANSKARRSPTPRNLGGDNQASIQQSVPALTSSPSASPTPEQSIEQLNNARRMELLEYTRECFLQHIDEQRLRLELAEQKVHTIDVEKQQLELEIKERCDMLGWLTKAHSRTEVEAFTRLELSKTESSMLAKERSESVKECIRFAWRVHRLHSGTKCKSNGKRGALQSDKSRRMTPRRVPSTSFGKRKRMWSPLMRRYIQFEPRRRSSSSEAQMLSDSEVRRQLKGYLQKQQQRKARLQEHSSGEYFTAQPLKKKIKRYQRYVDMSELNRSKERKEKSEVYSSTSNISCRAVFGGDGSMGDLAVDSRPRPIFMRHHWPRRIRQKNKDKSEKQKEGTTQSAAVVSPSSQEPTTSTNCTQFTQTEALWPSPRMGPEQSSLVARNRRKTQRGLHLQLSRSHQRRPDTLGASEQFQLSDQELEAERNIFQQLLLGSETDSNGRPQLLIENALMEHKLLVAKQRERHLKQLQAQMMKASVEVLQLLDVTKDVAKPEVENQCNRTCILWRNELQLAVKPLAKVPCRIFGMLFEPLLHDGDDQMELRLQISDLDVQLENHLISRLNRALDKCHSCCCQHRLLPGWKSHLDPDMSQRKLLATHSFQLLRQLFDEHCSKSRAIWLGALQTIEKLYFEQIAENMSTGRPMKRSNLNKDQKQ
ncbi:trichohyalin-like [Drosophila hydei]|uniref:Trichohyalin-like n=1 Tax=Drosophila hydei TaxID=7224 RepID=A0A6J2SQG2_DROHY|nr:trichohyalin-like [Drosophila hydei]